MHGLDGLRTLAVLAVMIYHLNYSWAPGGLLGVGIFFVLSGYLITGILLRQWKQHHRLDLKDFWIRRAKRLLPALFTMLIAVIVWSYFFNRDGLRVIREESFAAVLYISNWWYIFNEESYFESFGPPSPFEHLWSLAVEEQFYLLFPLICWLGLRWISKSKWLLALFLGLACISAGLMAWLYQPGEDPTRVYFGTDTRAFALLIGSALAILYPSDRFKEFYSRKKRNLLDGLGIICLLLLIGFIFGMSEYNSFLFQGGLVLISIITAILIGVIAHPSSELGKLFSCKPLKWLGERSYGIYLWHYPVIVLSSPVSNVDGIQLSRIFLQILVTIGLAAVSYRWIENPIRYGKFSRPMMVKSTIAILAGVLLLVLPTSKFGTDITATPVSTNFENKKETVESATLETEALPASGSEPAAIASPEPAQKPPAVSAQDPAAAAPSPESLSASTHGSVPAPLPAESGVTVIGDSITLDIEPYLEQLIPGIVVDGKIGRQLVKTPQEITNLKSNGNLDNIVIIQLGTNGPFTWEQLQNLHQFLGNPKQVIFVNSRVPRPWEGNVNSMLAKFVESTPNTALVDWYSKSASQSGYFAQDGVHLTSEGSKVLASMIKEAIQP